jgi:hypothetical protein
VNEVPNSEITIETYQEIEIGKTLYRVTSVFTGELDLKNALEELTAKRVMQSEV